MSFSFAELQSAIIRHPLIASPETRVIDAIAQMSGVQSCRQLAQTPVQSLDPPSNRHDSCVLVVDAGEVLGILTERDVVRLGARQQPLEQFSLRQVMAHPIITLPESDFTDLLTVLNLFQQHSIRHLPILNEHQALVGLVTQESLRHICRPIDLLRLRLVSEVMTHQVVCATPDDSLLTIARQMAEHRISSVVIVKSQETDSRTPLGILTERDIVQCQVLGFNLDQYKAKQVMSTPLFTVQATDSLWTVQQAMQENFIRRMVVTGEAGELQGIVTQTNLLNALNPLELYNLTKVLEEKVARLEAENISLLQNRAVELEQQVESAPLPFKRSPDEKNY
ncbi:MAG: CBS domain-containing protein [Kamptonema sp. SIO4C4]|nr:CBS domain-containing protein [Kamptonema sp. SIO4C4]